MSLLVLEGTELEKIKTSHQLLKIAANTYLEIIYQYSQISFIDHLNIKSTCLLGSDFIGVQG